MAPQGTQRGFTLFYAVLAASLLLSLGLAIFNITYKELLLSSGARESANAFYAADTGLECALYWDLQAASLGQPAFGFYGDSLATGLMHIWRFNEGSGNTTADSSGAGNTGTLANPAWSTDHLGAANKGLLFDGIDDDVDITTVTLPEEFTVTLWYNATNNGQLGQMISGGGPNDTPGAQRKFGFLWSGGVFSYFIRVINGGPAASAPVAPNVGIGAQTGWHHMAIRRDSNNNIDLFIDGGTPMRALNNQSGPFQLYGIGGSDPTTNTQMFAGSLDDFRVYSRALTDTEIIRMAGNLPNNVFVNPVQPLSDVICANVDVSDPANAWEPDTSWDVSTTTQSATTTFNFNLSNGRCAKVTVAKDLSTTTIVSRGYNTCVENNPRRVERAIQAVY